MYYIISISDPSSVYGYALFSIHHNAMKYIAGIIILVYGLLYKLIVDFNSDFIRDLYICDTDNIKQNLSFSNITSGFINICQIYLLQLNYNLLFALCGSYRFIDYYYQSIRNYLYAQESIPFYVVSLYMRGFTGFFGLDINLDYKDNLTVTKLDFLGRRLFDVETYSFNKDCVDSWIFDIARSEHGSKDFNYGNTERKIYNIFSNKKNDAFFYNGLKYVSNYFYNRPFFFQARTGNRKHKLSAAFYKHVLYDDAISYIGQRLHGLAFKQYLPWEFLGLVGPTLVVYVILSPSVGLLYASDDYNMVYPKLTYKVIGHQWYWEYQFIKQYIVTSHSSGSKSIQAKSLLDYSTGNSQITNYAHDRLYPNPRIGHYFVHMGHKVYDLFSNNVALENLVKGTKRLLTTNNAIIIPCNQTLRFMITSDDVLHAWGIPDLAIKMDAVPGRLNSFNALVTRPGVYFGSCFELCGVYHGFMPINVLATSPDVVDRSYDNVPIDFINKEEFYKMMLSAIQSAIAVELEEQLEEGSLNSNFCPELGDFLTGLDFEGEDVSLEKYNLFCELIDIIVLTGKGTNLEDEIFIELLSRSQEFIKNCILLAEKNKN